MSIEISLWDKETHEEVMSLNWLRNPFGLERWAEENVGVDLNLQEKERLGYVCNNWNYDESEEIDRKLFKKVVDNYWSIVEKLKGGYFVFDLPEYREMVEGPVGKKLTNADYEYRENYTKIAIRIECFKNEPSLNIPSLEKYKEWFHQLVIFAEKLQEPGIVFHCSN